MKIRIKVVETIVSSFDTDVPDEEAGDDLRAWVRQCGEEIWCSLDNQQDHFDYVEERTVSFDRVLP